MSRKFVWARASIGEASLGPDAVARTNLLGAFETVFGAQLIGTTVMRIRGVVTVKTSATTGFQKLLMAAKVDSEQTPAPVSADGPYGSPHDDWMLYEPFLVTAGAAEAPNPAVTASRVIDVKSARRIDEIGDELQLWFHAHPGNVAATLVRYSYDLSIGLKLP